MSSDEEEEELSLTMYAAAPQTEIEILPEPSSSRLRRSHKYAISKSIDLDKEEELQEKSSRIKCIVVIVVSLVILAVLIGVVVAVVRDDRRGNGNVEALEYPLMDNGHAVINDTQYFCAPIHGIVEGDVFAFKGIPYARAPVGNLRWLPPEPLHNQVGYCWIRNETWGYEASEFGSKCFQRHWNDSVLYEGSEDCLYINVWTPELGADNLRCVMVYIHGGDLLSGSGHDQDTVPTSNVVRNTDCVFVSFNYRLNAFGFLNLKTTENEALHRNLGFRDQIFALQWVKTHITAFGGDPDRVTLYGDGAGASSILVLLSSPLAKGFFHRAWLISPAPKLDGTEEQADHQNAGILQKTGCTKGSHQNRVKCLRDVPADQILGMSTFDRTYDPHKRTFPQEGQFGEVMAVADGVVIPKPSVIESWETGPANDVPLIIGSSAQEVDDYPDFPVYNKTSWGEYEDYVKINFLNFGRSISARVLKFYPANNRTSPELLISSMISDIRAICPTNAMSSAAATYFKSPVYRYVNKHHSVTPPKASAGKQYAFHKQDLYAFLGNVELYSDMLLSSDTSQSHLFQLRIGEFAQEGDIEYAWQPYPNSTAEFQSGRPSILEREEYKELVCDYWRIMGFYPAYAWTL